MKKFLLLTLFPFSLSAQNTVCLDLVPNPNPSDPALQHFVKYVDVLGCIDIYAEAGISDDKILHAAAVAAELLDNDENGVVDDPMVQAELSGANVVMPLLISEGSPAENAMMNNFNGCLGAVLYNDEIDPSQPGHWGSGCHCRRNSAHH